MTCVIRLIFFPFEMCVFLVFIGMCSNQQCGICPWYNHSVQFHERKYKDDVEPVPLNVCLCACASLLLVNSVLYSLRTEIPVKHLGFTTRALTQVSTKELLTGHYFPKRNDSNSCGPSTYPIGIQFNTFLWLSADNEQQLQWSGTVAPNHTAHVRIHHLCMFSIDTGLS